MEVTVTVTVNGSTKRLTTDPARSILDALREELRHTGSGHRCGRVRCGGCVILLDNQRVLACDIPIIQADQRTITTIEMDSTSTPNSKVAASASGQPVNLRGRPTGEPIPVHEGRFPVPARACAPLSLRLVTGE